MYEKHFNLSRKPFSVAPDPRFFFPSQGHRDALNHLAEGVHEGRGLMSLVGEVGFGKSTLIRKLRRELDSTIRTTIISHTTLDKIAILQLFASELELKVTGSQPVDQLIAIQKYCVAAAKEGKAAPLLIIDEAQNLSQEALEEIRLLTNIETDERKLLQLILAGQPELDEKLQRVELRQLRQRLGVQVELSPLTYAETLFYVSHRLRKSGGHDTGYPFSRPALDLVWRASRGTPRLINLVCDQSLVVTFRRKHPSVEVIDVIRASLDLKLTLGAPCLQSEHPDNPLLFASEEEILRVASSSK